MTLSQRRVSLVRRLRKRKTREREAAVLVEGVRAVGEALGAGVAVRFAVVSPRLAASSGGSALAGLLADREIETVVVDDVELTALSDTEHPQGVLLVCEEPASGSGVLSPDGRYLVLDAVQDPGNAGTLVRAATAFGLDGVVALDGTVDLWSAKAVRASAGMVFRITLASVTAGELLERTSPEGIAILVADARGTDVAELGKTGGWTLVVGNEGSGPRPEVTKAGVERVKVPMRGPAESLNVGMAGAILLYALTRETVVGG